MASGGSQPTQQNVTTTTSNLPEYAAPYFKNLMSRAEAWSNKPYEAYPYERIAGFTDAQKQLQGNILGMQTPKQFADASGMASAAGLGSLRAANFAPTQFTAQQVGLPELQQYRMQDTGDVVAGNYNAPQMQAAQTRFTPELTAYQMANPLSVTEQGMAERYMSPYMRNVLDVQKREAQTDARKAQLAQDLGAARQGTYGGARQLLAATERERALGQQMGDIEAQGMQSAYGAAMQQFNAEQQARQQAEQANLQSKLGVQQLGTQTGLQAALANLDAASQANVQNLAAQLQTQGMNADQALRAALANQQSRLSVGQANLQAGLGTQQLGVQSGLQALMANQQQALEAQRLAEQSKQFGAQNQLAAFGQAGQMAQTMGNLGQYQQQADLQRLQAQQGAAGQAQALEQQYLDQYYADFLRQRDADMERLGYASNILRGLPVGLNTTNITYAPSPSMASQVLGTGLGALGMYNTLRG
jgi:hypothetical protein